MPARRTAHSVVIAVDPHEASWTALAVNERLQPLGAARAVVGHEGYRQSRRLARRWPDATRAIEGAMGVGAPLTARLAEDGIETLDVPAKLARRVRLLSTDNGRKSDEADAQSVGIAAHTATDLRATRIDDHVAALRALTEHRDDMVRARTQTVSRLHTMLAGADARPERRCRSHRAADHTPTHHPRPHPAAPGS